MLPSLHRFCGLGANRLDMMMEDERTPNPVSGRRKSSELKNRWKQVASPGEYIIFYLRKQQQQAVISISQFLRRRTNRGRAGNVRHLRGARRPSKAAKTGPTGRGKSRNPRQNSKPEPSADDVGRAHEEVYRVVTLAAQKLGRNN